MTRHNLGQFTPLVAETKKTQKIYFGESTDEEFIILAYQKCLALRCFCYFLYIVTGGLLFLFLHWYKNWWLVFNARQVPVGDSDILLVRETATGQCWLVDVELWNWKTLVAHAHHIIGHVSFKEESLVTFLHKHQRFVLIDSQLFVMSGLSGLTCDEILKQSGGVNDDGDVESRRQIFGENVIIVLVPSAFRILVDEILSPFYMFQIFSVILWMCDEYYIYATSILCITTVSMSVTLYTVRSERKKLQNMVQKNNYSTVKCWRGGKWTDIWSNLLVPGDVISVPPGGCCVPADCLLLTGEAIVNEGMLTGECIPVTKLALRASSTIYHPDNHTLKMNTLYGGTEIIQTRTQSSGCTAMVTRVGFETAKGTLVHSILFPKPINHKLEHDGMKFLSILGCIALVGFVYSIVVAAVGCVKAKMIITKSLDLITIVVPPALPAALAVGIMFAQKRLKKQNIFTVSPQRINLSGSVNMALFDKTGTLTEDGLVYLGVVTDFNSNEITNTIPPDSKLIESLAVCHSLTHINNEICGDPLEVEMFDATKWKLVESQLPEEENTDTFDLTYVQNPAGTLKIYQIRQFPFTSEDARQTLVAQCVYPDNQKDLVTFIKGAPERIAKICNPKSVPTNFNTRLDALSSKGYRVLALAYKPLKIKRWKALKAERSVLEEDATFLGFLILQNRVKPESSGVITELRNANIRTAMVTGDNILTAISVSTECGIISPHDRILIPEISDDNKVVWRQNNQIDRSQVIELKTIQNDETNFIVAMTGETFDWIVQNHPSLLSYILVRGAVFARMSPDNKAALVDIYENMDFTCSFCGDGANDCGALKRASVGVSLSELEASVASPFTSKCGNISCVTDLVREGRAALMTSFGMFKYMALYSMIQFCTILILYWRKSNLSDMEYLYIDLLIIDLVALTMSLNRAYSTISEISPPKVLVSGPTIFSLIIHVIICVLFQVGVYKYTINQIWFCSPSDGYPPCWDASGDPIINPNNGTIPSSPNTLYYREKCEIEGLEEEYHVEFYGSVALFLFSQFQYIHMSFVFSVGKPFRQPIWKNIYFMAALLILTASSIFILLSDAEWVIHLFELQYENLPPIPSATESSFRYILLITAAVNWVVSWLVEEFVVENKELWNRLKWFQKKRHKNKKFLSIEDEVNENDYWPPKLSTNNVKMNQL